MSVVAFIRECIAKGLTPEQALEAAKVVESETPKTSVYVIDEPDTEFVKIGISTNPGCRAHELSAGNPRLLRVAWVSEPYTRMRALEIERGAHFLLGSQLARREWFGATVEEAVRAIEKSRAQQ